jgi:hypothetical protein
MERMPPSIRVVALIAAYNEEDVIGQALAHLIGQGASAYLLDDGSTDATAGIARTFLGNGLIGIEPLGKLESGSGTFCLSRILRRKEELAESLDADWFINQDADEFRESPWPHLSLSAAIELVDRLGWNAIDFEVLNFVPEAAAFRPGDDLAQRFSRYVPGADYDRLQVRCWKKTSDRADLASSAGHDVSFAGRRVFPIRFPMRHYPFRSESHAQRKVFGERKPRFDADERRRGWHVQYDRFAEGSSVVATTGVGAAYDADAINVSVQLLNRLVESACPWPAADPGAALAASVERLEEAIARGRAEAEVLKGREALQKAQVAALDRELAERRREAQRLRDREAQLAAQVDRLEHDLNQGQREADALRETVRRLNDGAQVVSRELQVVLASRSWRITAPLRAIWRLLGRT